MPVVVTCPGCQRKARVPDAMLGQSVKCPECGMTFTVPADANLPVPRPPTVETAPPEPGTRPPLPADGDSLRAVRSGAGVQLMAHCLYAAALALLLLTVLIVFADTLSVGSGFGGRTRTGISLPLACSLLAMMLLLVAGLINTVGAAINVLAPPAHLARGLAIAVAILTVIAFMELASVSGLVFFFMDPMPGRIGGFDNPYWLTGIVILWIVDITRLVILNLFWRSMSRILRDARGTTLARRLAIAGPVVQVALVFAWIVIAMLGAGGQEVAMFAVIGWLAVQFFVVLAGVGVVARLWRRLKAAVPAGA
jgi:hypothetical protein